MSDFKSTILGGSSEKKGDDKGPPSAALGEIPDELPSLVEDSVKPDESGEVPADLPEISPEVEKKLYGKEIDQLPLGPEEEEDRRLREYIASELKKGFTLEEIRDVLLRAKHPEVHVSKIIKEFQTEVEPQKISEPEEPVPVNKTEIKIVDEPLKISTKPGFFSHLLNMISKHDDAKEKLLNGDLFARMEQDWKIREKEHKEEIIISSEQQLRKQMTNTLEELEDLENKWQIQKAVLEAESKKMTDKERAIKEKIAELRKLLQKLEFYKNVKPEHFFHFINGIVVKNLQELIDVLKVIDDDTFYHHVNLHRNDLSAWIYHAIGKDEIASRISDIKSREEIIKILEAFAE